MTDILGDLDYKEIWNDIRNSYGADSVDHGGRRGTVLTDDQRALIQRARVWEAAYPLDAFPEPDLMKVRQVLAANGLDISAVTASNMRYVVAKVVTPLADALEAAAKDPGVS